LLGFALGENGRNAGLPYKITGVVVLVFCVITAGQKVKKRNETNSGLIINKEGIHDLSSAIAIGLIKWKDIVEIDETVSRESRLIILKVKKQNDYLKKAKNAAVGRLLNQNIREFDTPVVIDTKYLNQSFDEIIEIVIREV